MYINIYVYVSLYIYIYIVYLRKRISIYQDPPSMRVSIYVNISANAQSIFLLASPDEFKPTTQLNLHVSLLCQFWLPFQHFSLLWAQGLLCPLKKKRGQTGRRPVWAAKIYTCPLMRTMMKSSLGPQLQGGEASEYLWDCFRGLCSSPKSWALSMVCWAGWAGQAGLGLTVNIQSTYSQHTVNIQSTRQSTCKETLIIYIQKAKVCIFFVCGGGLHKINIM